MKKRCFKCGKTKDIDDFYKHPEMKDGHLNKCKTCCIGESIEKTRKIYSDPELIKKERLRGREKYNRLYRGHGGNGTTGAKRAWINRNPEKRAAHVLTHAAVRDGRLKKTPCEVCGNPEVEGHHDDYAKPLEVRWLCSLHHNNYHIEMREVILG